MLVNYAHRGASKYYPENTMLAFKKAIEMGATGLETDIHMTKDGVLVLVHDELVNRTTDNIGFIKDYTYKELSNLDAGSYLSSQFSNIRIPTLNEFLEFSKDKNIMINLELKTNVFSYKNLEENVLDLIYKYGIENKVIISSFNINSLRKIKQLTNSIKIAVACMFSLSIGKTFCKTLKTKKLNPYYKLIMNLDSINNMKKSNFLIVPYTVDNVDDLKFFIECNVDGIITNYPDKLSKLLNSY